MKSSLAAPMQSAPSRPAAEERRLRFVRRLALACAALVLAVTSLSAYIRLSRAGLSCADWPQCYGQGLRELQQGRPATSGEGAGTAAARLAHRVVASGALLLVIAMLATALTARPILSQQARVAAALLALALFLAVLGRWSSDARLPAVAMANLLGGFVMLALCWRLAWRAEGAASAAVRATAGLGVALLVVQVALGGLLSASHSATSCATGLADCLAAARDVPIAALDPWREPQLVGTAPVNPDGALVQAVHRLCGLAAASVLAGAGLAALLGARRRVGALLLVALAATLALGLAMAAQGSTLALALAHNVLAALLLVTALELSRGPQRDVPA